MPPGTHPAVLLGAVIGAEAPDVDFVVRFWGGRIGYLKEHRGLTHGLMLLPLEAGAIAVVLHLFWPAAPLWPLFLWSLLGALSHVLFDFANDYGTGGLWPFSNRKIAWDIVPIIDLWLLGIFGAGWLLTAVWPGHRSLIFAAAWGLVGLYLLLRFWLRDRAQQIMAGQYDIQGQCKGVAPCGPGWREERLVVHPTMLSLRAWHYVVQMPDHFRMGMVWVDTGKVGTPRLLPNAPLSPAVEASFRSHFVTAFAQWARRPRVSVEQETGIYHVRWTDIRYEMGDFSPFTAEAWLDQDLKLIDDRLGEQGLRSIEKPLLKRLFRQEMGVEDP